MVFVAFVVQCMNVCRVHVVLCCVVLPSLAECRREATTTKGSAWEVASLLLCLMMMVIILIIIIINRSYATLWAADLDWIVGPEYSLGGYI